MEAQGGHVAPVEDGFSLDLLLLSLDGFAWFEDLRPVNKDDVFIWRGKADANRLKAIPRRRAPMQTLQRLKEKAVPTTANRSTEEGNAVPESEHGGQQSEEEP